MRYKGPERRIHKVLVTRNTEYHMRGAECVAVRDTDSGTWHSEHQAVGSELVGCIGVAGKGSYRVRQGEPPSVGDRLCFSADLLTSPLVNVRRPSPQTVIAYRAPQRQAG